MEEKWEYTFKMSPEQGEKGPELEKFIRNSAIFEIEPSLKGISKTLFIPEPGSIYYGTGVCTPTQISRGLPFDTLGIILAAEKTRRILGFNRIYHHIADTHAKSNKLFDANEIDRISHQTQEKIQRVVQNLGLKSLEVVLASLFDQTEGYLDILQNVKTAEHEYVRREIADIEWYRRERALRLKMSWIIQATETVLGSDERIFDREYKHNFGDQVSFLYLKAGRTFDPQRPKASPYISIEGETRILLERGERVKDKIEQGVKNFRGDRSIGGGKRHLVNIVRLYEELFGPINNLSLEDKVQQIIDHVIA